MDLNTDNRQYCKGCEKNLASSLFITNGKSYHTCNNCHLQNKANYQRRKQQDTDQLDQMPIEFDDLSDFIFNIFDTINSERKCENKENETNTKFEFSSTVNIAALKGNSKERANDIIKVISDVDEYMWM
jgi:GTPase Era involved in 16S rRNA processing